MALSKAESFGLADQFLQFIEENQALLQGKGLDVSSWITDITDKKKDAVLQTNKQDDMEASAKAQTKIAKDAVKFVYDTTSTRIDAVIGVVGKNTPLAKQLSKLRSSLIKQKRKKPNDPDAK